MSPAVKSKHHQVLVVEDLDYEYEAIESAIEDVVPNCTFVEAKSVVEAEGILEKEDTLVDLIVLDLKLGESPEEGLTLLAPDRVWHYRRPPVVICTAVPNMDAQAAYEVGVSACVHKLDERAVEELQKAVTRILLGEARTSLGTLYVKAELLYRIPGLFALVAICSFFFSVSCAVNLVFIEEHRFFPAMLCYVSAGVSVELTLAGVLLYWYFKRKILGRL